MITESFLNNCFGLVLGKKQRDLEDTTYLDLLHYLKFVKKQADSGAFEIPIPIMNKFDMMKHLCELKVLRWFLPGISFIHSALGKI